jgi:hypothetical protein
VAVGLALNVRPDPIQRNRLAAAVSAAVCVPLPPVSRWIIVEHAELCPGGFAVILEIRRRGTTIDAAQSPQPAPRNARRADRTQIAQLFAVFDQLAEPERERLLAFAEQLLVPP